MNARATEQLFYRLKERVACDLDIAFCVNDCKKNAAICFDNPLEIRVSRYFIESPTTTTERLEDVLLHELAHAMVGPGEGHNDTWKACALKIGCTSCVCVGPFLKKKDYNYVLTCPGGCSLRRLKVKKLNICTEHKTVMKVVKI
jgi:predicted SprT family Zn-dependent metalloprotease